MEKLEEKIKKLTEKRDYSIKKLATEVGMSEGGFYNMLNNDSIKIKTLAKIAEVLDVDIKYFFEGGDNFEKIKKTDENLVSYLMEDNRFMKKQLDFFQNLIIPKLDNLEKLGKPNGATTLNGVGFLELDYSDMAFRAN